MQEELNPDDLRIDTYHAGEHSGFIHTNHTAVRITHLPTGVYVESKEERSLHKNKQRCMELLPAAIQEAEKSQQAATIARYETTAENCDLLRAKVDEQAREIERLTQHIEQQDDAYALLSLDAARKMDELEQQLAALTATAPNHSEQVREGWQLVPVEPTPEMLQAGADEPLAGDSEDDAPEDYRAVYKAMLAAAPSAADLPGECVAVPGAWNDVQAERQRQVKAEGWTTAHDDLYQSAELPRAAASYILSGANDEAPYIWPFASKWWKPKDARANYVRAAALILAEVERIDRALLAQQGKAVGDE